MSLAIVVEEIGCDRCGYWDTADKFPEAPPEIQKEFGSVYAGAICSECGNFSEFDFDPHGKRQQGTLKLEFVP